MYKMVTQSMYKFSLKPWQMRSLTPNLEEWLEMATFRPPMNLHTRNLSGVALRMMIYLSPEPR